MKKLLKNPGFEFIFSVVLILILALPPMLLAQNTKVQKDIDIRIQDGDTTINGKNIKDLSAADRESALNDINNLRGERRMSERKGGSIGKTYQFYRFKSPDSAGSMRNFKSWKHNGDNGDNLVYSEKVVTRDSMGNVIEMHPGKMKKRMQFNYEMNDDEDRGDMRMRARAFNRMPGMRRGDRRNTQNFEYDNINNDGVATHISFHVSEASDDDLKRMPYVEGPKFEIKDLNLVPQFSSGKVLLMFNLLSKAPAEVKLSDTDGKMIWSEKALNGSFSKSFALGLNGVYYLQIQQGKSISLKKIMKEE